MTFPVADWRSGAVASDVDGRGVDAEFAAQFGNGDSYGETLAFIVVHRGVVVAERYASTVDPTTKLISWSMAKSITDALVGMCAKDGLLALDERARVSV